MAATIRLGECRRYYLVGIGGAGLSGVARMMKSRGLDVAGSDASDSPVVEALRCFGVPVKVGHGAAGLEPGDGLVVSDAIDLDASPEVREAEALGLPLFRRSQALAWLLAGKRCICVTGSHGKTTTAAMVGAGLRAAGVDATVVVGAEVPQFGGAVLEGGSDWAVIEACEAYDSLRDFQPEVVVLTNLEFDHSDFHGSFDALRESVQRFVAKTPPSGALLYSGADSGAASIAESFRGDKVDYSAQPFPEPSLALPGHHNRVNAAGALAACVLAGADPVRAAAAIAAFRGAERRLQTQRHGATILVDDYAHHPTEVLATIRAVRDGHPGLPVLAVFQPHLYSRTADFIAEFAAALSEADAVVLTDIYPARERPIPGISSARIAELVQAPCRYVPSRHLLPRLVAKWVGPGWKPAALKWPLPEPERDDWLPGRFDGEHVVLAMGAGNISEFASGFLAELERRGGRPQVAVLDGGDSAEREVSLHSGMAVAAALEARGYGVRRIDVSERLLADGNLGPLSSGPRPDVGFLCVHGTHAEDGAIQGLLELAGIPYTGSGILASAIAMDKQRAKQALAAAGLPVPDGRIVGKVEDAFGAKTPCVVKPNSQGSTVGLSFVERDEDLAPAVDRALAYDRFALVEELVDGIEISVPVLGGRALPAVEIVPESGRYDFESKYVPGATREIVPARISDDAARLAADLAIRAHEVLGCAGATRTDMIVRPDRRIVVLEVNTLPGMTPTSLLPNSARATGLEFEDLCEWMVWDALVRGDGR